MSGGIKLWQGGNDSFRNWPHEQGDATHIAYPADVARARDAVVSAAIWAHAADSDESWAALDTAIAALAAPDADRSET